ncbi:hypothetical protein Pcinc_005978 [Petrolisthes cinctipes]|uniref:Uncharacterized protein n=1 Tax=Petrolisthes cinctipes TaxID=88211 RepID=A0AAE1KZK9_PETCI|nr:hypothetical protein Pcinc_005978 [Petrolisthes cinctipes]
MPSTISDATCSSLHTRKATLHLRYNHTVDAPQDTPSTITNTTCSPLRTVTAMPHLRYSTNSSSPYILTMPRRSPTFTATAIRSASSQRETPKHLLVGGGKELCM